MTEVFDLFKNIRTWRAGDKRAPHKPLLILLAIAELKRGNKILSYEKTEDKLKKLLIDFGPPRKVFSPNYPFIRLAGDGLWEIKFHLHLESTKDKSPSFLKSNRVKAGFTKEVTDALEHSDNLINKIINHLLEENFPASLHREILNATGLREYVLRTLNMRDPQFRDRILAAYGYKCAVCEYGVRLSHQLVGLEAAHIKWHKANGPSDVNNGIALCSLHHLLLDNGGFTLDNNLKIRVSNIANGYGVEQWLHRFDGKSIYMPRQKKEYPEPEFLDWHFQEVFKGYGETR